MRVYTEKELFAMSNSQLREIYKRIRLVQKRFARFPVAISIPAMLFYFFFGWELLNKKGGNFIHLFFDCTLTGFLDFLFFAICGIFLTTDDTNFTAAIAIIFAALTLLKYILFQSFGFISAAMFLYLIVACSVIYKNNRTLHSLKKLSAFPFQQKFD